MGTHLQLSLKVDAKCSYVHSTTTLISNFDIFKQLLAVTAQTGSGYCASFDRCGMDPPSYITIRLVSVVDDLCISNHLGSRANDFEEGQVDIFKSGNLGECGTRDFTLTPQFAWICHHASDDGWCLDSVELFFDNGKRYKKTFGKCLDDNNCFYWEL